MQVESIIFKRYQQKYEKKSIIWIFANSEMREILVLHVYSTGWLLLWRLWPEYNIEYEEQIFRSSIAGDRGSIFL